MPFSQNEKSKKFVKQVKSLIDTGAVSSLTEISEAVEWNRTALSQVLNGSRNVPNDVYARFTNRYNETPSDVADYKEEQIAFLKEQNQFYKEQISLLTEKLKTIDKIMASLNEIAENQFLFGATQQGWQEWWSEHLPMKPKVPPHVIKETINKKAASLLRSYEEKGKEVFYQQDN